MRKPNVGEIIDITSLNMRETMDCFSAKVIAVYDSLVKSEPGGNWDPWGENAMAMQEANEENGMEGEWYVMAEPISGMEQDTAWPLASYEVKVRD